MLRFALARLLQLPLILGVIFVVCFACVWVLPGDPLTRPDGHRPPEAVQEAMERRYALHSPWAFAASYLQRVMVGDFGPSLRYRDQEVKDILLRGLPVSAMLGALALAIAFFAGTGVGLLGSVRGARVMDAGGMAVTLVGISLPSFVTGSVLLVVFAGLLEWLPAGGWGRPAHLVLPAITLAAAPAAYITRLTRLGLAEVMGSDFIRTARAKGAGELRVLFRHALKVALLPVLSFLGPAAAAAMTGSFVVEKIFNVPGMGEHFVDAVRNKDPFLILGVVLVYATLLILFNLAVDLAYAFVDPRIEAPG